MTLKLKKSILKIHLLNSLRTVTAECRVFALLTYITHNAYTEYGTSKS